MLSEQLIEKKKVNLLKNVVLFEKKLYKCSENGRFARILKSFIENKISRLLPHIPIVT